MIWDQVVGHTAAKHNLMRAVEQDRVNHAYMFTGPSAVGKFMVARAFAAALLCPEGGCGRCNTCRRVMEGKHPDLTVIKPAGKNIPVETIREMRMSAFRKPIEADRKVYIVKNADRMWEEGASTLLKVLEEPPGDVVFILVTSNPAGLLPTIHSRCQEVAFSMLPPDQLRDYLLSVKEVTPERADIIVRVTGGVLGRALDWCDQPWRLERRDYVIKAARALRRTDLSHSLDMAEQLYGRVRSPGDVISTRYAERKEELADGSLDDGLVRRLGKELDEECKREQLKEEIRGVKEVLATMLWWYRDILIMKEGGDPALLVNRDREREIEDEADAVPSARLLACIELLNDSMRAAEQNVPAQLNLESTLLGIQEALYA